MKSDHNSHAVFLLYYHLVMVIKYRRKVLNDEISERAKEIFEYITPGYGIVLEEWNHDTDHVHVMFRAQPKTELSKFINACKSASSRLLKKEYPQIREKLWKGAFWSQSFCLLSAGGAPIETIRQYIERVRRMNRAVKIRIYPNKEQKVQIEKTIGCSRFIYNQMLADKISYYQKEKKMLRNTPAGYKKEYPWLKEVDSLALANVQLHLEGAFRKFFREPSCGFPRYKSKKHAGNSYTTNVVNGNIFLQDTHLKLPKMSAIKIKLHRQIPSDWELKSVTISREPSGKYFASLLFCCESQTVEKRPAEKFLGIDFAMRGMCVFSTGERAGYPMFYRKAEKKLAREQRKLSHCEKGSRNYQKQKKRVALCHEKIKNQRKDFQHKLSRALAERYDAVCVEDLNLKGMSGGLHLGKGVQDNGYGQFLSMLGYKLEERGKHLIKVDRYFASSKICSVCGHKKKELALSDREYVCECGNRMDRDVNAAVNIREEGKRLYKECA